MAGRSKTDQSAEKTHGKPDDRHCQDEDGQSRRTGNDIENITKPGNALREESADISQKRRHKNTTLHVLQTPEQTHGKADDRHSQDEDQQGGVGNDGIENSTQPSHSLSKELADRSQESAHGGRLHR